jgi:hypothetical protein
MKAFVKGFCITGATQPTRRPSLGPALAAPLAARHAGGLLRDAADDGDPPARQSRAPVANCSTYSAEFYWEEPPGARVTRRLEGFAAAMARIEVDVEEQ